MPASPEDGDWPEAGEPGLGLYVHWPFCAAKCPYCDFNSHVRRGLDTAPYARALIRELEHVHARVGGGPLDSIFFGGGTPSLMDPAHVAWVIETADRLWGLGQDAEISLEANPTSTDAARFAGFRSAGVNRVSIGVQALRDDALKFLGRLHSVAEARAAIEIARGAFERLSFDMIYARPRQTLADWRVELREAIALAADHLSLYQLTIEPGTPFFDLHQRGAFDIPDDDLAADLYAATTQECAAAGLEAYEVSNYARPGAESRHNLVYWRYGDYVGVGPGAHGRVTLEGRKVATETIRNPEAWRSAVEDRGHGLSLEEPLSEGDQRAEMVLMGLRLREGISVDRVSAIAGRPLAASALRDLGADGLIDHRMGRVRVTEKGRPVLNAIIEKILDDQVDRSSLNLSL